MMPASFTSSPFQIPVALSSLRERKIVVRYTDKQGAMAAGQKGRHFSLPDESPRLRGYTLHVTIAFIYRSRIALLVNPS
jgi:hypothetical protein